MHVQSVQKLLFFIVKYANLWGFRFRCRRGCLSSLIFNECRLRQIFKRYVCNIFGKFRWKFPITDRCLTQRQALCN